MKIEFREASVDRGDGAVLEAAMRVEVAAVCSGIDPGDPRMPAAGARELGPPRGAFVVGYAAGEPVCCGGIKHLDERACEIKRMYVVPAARGRGAARLLLAELERRARRLGYAVARLDTDERLSAALRLYESADYRPIGNFNDNPVATFFGEKPLEDEARGR
ncbi:MAG: GNAT family N-acetyltransferase [Solirubrobacteraceae bacterium]